MDSRTEINLNVPGAIGAELSRVVLAMRVALRGVHGKGDAASSMGPLNDAIDQAHGLAMRSQQLTRLARGGLRQSHEMLRLDTMLLQALREREHYAATADRLDASLNAIDVVYDAGLLHSLLRTALDWIDGLGSPEPALVMLMAHNEGVTLLLEKRRSAAEALAQSRDIDSLPWHLTVQICSTMNVWMERHLAVNKVTLRLELTRTLDRLRVLAQHQR